MKNILYILLFLSTTVSAQWQWKKETDSTKLVNGTHSLFLGGHRMLNYKDTLSGGVIKKYVDAHSGGVGIYIPITDTIASKVITRKKLDSLNYLRVYPSNANGVFAYSWAQPNHFNRILTWNGYFQSVSLRADTLKIAGVNTFSNVLLSGANLNLQTQVIKTNGTTSASGYFDNGTTDPTSTTIRTNYNGIFWSSALSVKNANDWAIINPLYIEIKNNAYSTTLNSNGSIQMGDIGTSTELLRLEPSIANVGTQTAFTLRSKNTLSGTTNLMVLKNNSNTKFTVTNSGKIISVDTVVGKSLRMTNATSNLGKYSLTQNSSTGEIYSQELAHAFYGFADLTTSFSLSSNATWYHVTNAGKNLWTNYEDDYVSISNDTITLGQSAHWEIHYHVVFTGSTGVWFKMRIYNVTKGQAIPIPTASTAAGTNFTSIGNTAYCTNCDSGDKIVLQMIPESNSQTITLIDGSILIKATHGIQ